MAHIQSPLSPEIEAELDRLHVDPTLRDLLREGFADRTLTVSASGSDFVELAPPKSRVVAYVAATHADFDLEAEVQRRLVEWHGELRLMDGGASNRTYLRVRDTDLLTPALRHSVVTALPAGYDWCAGQDVPVQQRTVRRASARTSKPAKVAAPRQPKVGSPIRPTGPEPAQDWEAVCDKCMMVHRVGVEC